MLSACRVRHAALFWEVTAMIKKVEKPHFLKGAASEISDLFDQIEVLVDKHGPPTDFPKSLFTARTEVIERLVSYDIVMTSLAGGRYPSD